MTPTHRLAFLIETVELEAQHLLDTDWRLFAQGFTSDRTAALRMNIDDFERTDAFVTRFGRLQDTVAEKLGLLNSADEWLAERKLRNRVVHQYVRDAAELAEAFNQGHALVPLLVELARHFGRLPAPRPACKLIAA